MDSQFLNSEMTYNYATISSAPPKKRAGRTKFRETRHPVYKGVRRRGANGARWVCEVREPNKKSRIWLGTFPTAEMAARAHDVAAMALRGRKACLNFADSAWRLTAPESCSHDDIRKAAVAAAGMFRPQSLSDVADEEQSSVTLAAASTSQSPETSVAAPDEVDTSLFDLIEFDRDFHHECYFGMPMEAVTGYQYQWDDANYECVADDVSLWSYSI